MHLSDDPRVRQLPLAQRAASRGLDIDDIAEIRPGRTAFDIDGSDIEPILCIIGSETVIRLPMDSVKKRNKLIDYFQSFVGLYKNHEFACSDQWAPLSSDDSFIVTQYDSDKLKTGNPALALLKFKTDSKIASFSHQYDDNASAANAAVLEHQTEPKRRGSHTLAECVIEMQSNATTVEIESEVQSSTTAVVVSELLPPSVFKDRCESWSGIVSGGFFLSSTST